jgi:RecB family exonuclease
MSVGGDRGAWLAFRDGRTAGTAAVFHGEAGLRRPGLYAVSRLDRYLECPFKYYAAHVLRLEEESAEAAGLTPLERGQFLHTVFEEFFSTWETRGGGPIGPGDLDAARALFAEVAERRLATLPETERALERTHLLGSAAAPGLADRLIALEIEQAVPVRQRLLEHSLEGRFSIAGADGPVRLHLRGKADRIDLLADGTLRIVDYKLGRAPKTVRALQLPAYAAAASQALEARDGRPWPVSWLGYVALRERNAFTPLGASPAAMVQAMADGQQRLIDTVAAIEQGHFPVDPDEPFMCTRCGFAGVCR